METGEMSETRETKEVYRSRLTGRMFKVERVVDNRTVSLIGVDKKMRCCSTKENLKLFYDKLPSPPLTPPPPLLTFKNS